MNKYMTVLASKLPKKSTYALQIVSLLALVFLILGNFHRLEPKSIQESDLKPVSSLQSRQGMNNSNFTLNI